MVDLKAPWFSEHYEKHLFDAPQLPESIYLEHLAKIKAQEGLASSGERGGESRLHLGLKDGPWTAHVRYVSARDSSETISIISTNKAFPLERLEGWRETSGGRRICLARRERQHRAG